ncbi:hypothetical protein [Streptomyces griseus]|uniref:hypothetical protein n=1 Tax=Streptomyces griseus TaxID=1911 RepID=UPI000563C2D4|nr:hypothetical protein [Streptomyces griseus]
MWPGEQPPAGDPNQPAQQPNPYQQPGYQQPGPDAQQPGQGYGYPQQPGHGYGYPQQPGYGYPQQPGPEAQQPGSGYGYPQPGSDAQHPGYQQQPFVQRPPAPWESPDYDYEDPERRSRRIKVIAITSAVVVVAAAAVTGVVFLGGKDDDKAAPGPTASPTTSKASPSPSPSRNPLKPTIAGWKVVVNPGLGVAFDVPADWVPQPRDHVTSIAEDKDPKHKPLVGMRAPAVLKSKWCMQDKNKDGKVEYTALAGAGTRGNNGAKSTAQIAAQDSANWAYGAYAQPDHKNVKTGPVTSFTTASGLKGSVATSHAVLVTVRGKCDTAGKATTFAFKNKYGSFSSWSFYGAEGVEEEVTDATVKKILSTVREFNRVRSGKGR